MGHSKSYYVCGTCSDIITCNHFNYKSSGCSCVKCGYVFNPAPDKPYTFYCECKDRIMYVLPNNTDIKQRINLERQCLYCNNLGYIPKLIQKNICSACNGTGGINTEYLQQREFERLININPLYTTIGWENGCPVCHNSGYVSVYDNMPCEKCKVMKNIPLWSDNVLYSVIDDRYLF